MTSGHAAGVTGGCPGARCHLAGLQHDHRFAGGNCAGHVDEMPAVVDGLDEHADRRGLIVGTQPFEGVGDRYVGGVTDAQES